MIPVPCGAGITKKWKLNICLQEPGRNFQNLRGPEKLAVVRAAHLVEVHSLPALPQLVVHKHALLKGHNRVHIAMHQQERRVIQFFADVGDRAQPGHIVRIGRAYFAPSKKGLNSDTP